MTSTGARPKTSTAILAVLGVALAVLAFHLAGGIALAQTGAGDGGPAAGAVQPQEADAGDREPEANLPFLFAVYTITWAVFFGYVVVVSRRQRELQQEVRALRESLESREKTEGQG